MHVVLDLQNPICAVAVAALLGSDAKKTKWQPLCFTPFSPCKVFIPPVNFLSHPQCSLDRFKFEFSYSLGY